MKIKKKNYLLDLFAKIHAMNTLLASLFAKERIMSLTVSMLWAIKFSGRQTDDIFLITELL